MISEGFEPVSGYRLTEFLGRDRFGQIWKASTSTDELNVVRFVEFSGPAVLRAYQEIARIQKVRHPNLMPITAVHVLNPHGMVIESTPLEASGAKVVSDESELHHLVVMTPFATKSILDRLHECIADGHRGIPVDALLSELKHAANAIDHLNGAKHDLESDQVWLRHDGLCSSNLRYLENNLVVSDFWLNRLLSYGRFTPMPEGDGLRFVSPEVIDGEVSPTSDQYSLAIVYYQLRTGRLPIEGDTVWTVLQALRNGALNFDLVSAAEQSVLRRATHLDWKLRFKSCSEFVASLLNCVFDNRTDSAFGNSPVPATCSAFVADPDERSHDNVEFTVYRPRAVAPGRWYTLLAFAHRDSDDDSTDGHAGPVEMVRRVAKRVLGQSVKQYKPTTQESRYAVPKESMLTFVPEAIGCSFNPPHQSILWLEEWHKVEFKMRADHSLDGTVARGRVSVYRGAILLADVPIRFDVSRQLPNDESGKPEIQESGRPYRKIFASYSHADLSVVQQFETYIETLGDRYVRDWRDLRSGERWNDRLMEMIREADVFQLFWSHNSMKSEFVRREWEYAISLTDKGPNFVRPTYWESPLPENTAQDLPPDELRKRHFTFLSAPSPSRTEPIKVEVSVFEGNSEIWNGICQTPLEIGRQQEGDTDSLGLQALIRGQRLVIAPVSVRSIPRRALQVESEPGDLRLVNIHPRLSFHVEGLSEPLTPAQEFRATDEIIVSLPKNRTIRVTRCDPDGDVFPSHNCGEGTHFRTLSGEAEPAMENVVPSRLNELFDGENKEDRDRAVDLLRSVLTVVQKAVGLDEVFASTVSAVAKIIELDRAMVVLRSGDDWTVRASYVTGSGVADSVSSAADIHFSRGLLQRVLNTGRTVLYDPASFVQSTESSMLILDRALAAPIFDENRRIIGAIYVDRQLGSSPMDSPIGDLEAALLEVMAGAVSSGIAHQEQGSTRSNQTPPVTPEIAERREDSEDLLTGKDADVSVLCCEIRGFHAIAERVGARRAIEWINDVRTELSGCVQRNQGVPVDSVGDGLMAIWGASAEQRNHAELACRTAVEMLRLVEPVRDRWKDITPDRFGLGIGINTGMARVDSTGSKNQFKYGPLGNTVNLASRLQGITRRLGVAALMTESTADSIGRLFDDRRLAVVRLIGIDEPVSVYELPANANEDWRNMSQQYEQALTAFEKGDLKEAARQLATLLENNPNDNPTVVLLGRVVDALMRQVKTVDPVWGMESN